MWTECCSVIAILCSPPKVTDLGVAVGRDEDVLELDVAVDVAMGVHVAQRERHARHVEARVVLRQPGRMEVEKAKEVNAITGQINPN